MMRWERKLQAGLRKHLLWWAFAAVLLLGALIRYSFLPLMVADMEFLNLGWFAAITRQVQTGYLYTYAFAMIIGLLILLTWFVAR